MIRVCLSFFFTPLAQTSLLSKAKHHKASRMVNNFEEDQFLQTYAVSKRNRMRLITVEVYQGLLVHVEPADSIIWPILGSY